MSATSSRVQGLLERIKKFKPGANTSIDSQNESKAAILPPLRPPEEPEKPLPTFPALQISTTKSTSPSQPPDFSSLMKTLNISEGAKASSSASSTPPLDRDAGNSVFPLSFRSVEPRSSRPRLPKSSRGSSRSSSGGSAGRYRLSPSRGSKPAQLASSLADNLKSFEKRCGDYMKQHSALTEQLNKLLQEQRSANGPQNRVQVAEENFKRKAKTLLETVRTEAVEMDRKFAELQSENTRLREQLSQQSDDNSPGLNESHISTKSTMSYIRGEARKDLSSFDFEEVLAEVEALGADETLGLESLDEKVTEAVEKVQSSFSDLSVFLSKHLLEEQSLRLRVEEATSKQIEEKESLIASLEQQLKVLTSLDSAHTSRMMQSEQEVLILAVHEDTSPAERLELVYKRQRAENATEADTTEKQMEDPLSS